MSSGTTGRVAVHVDRTGVGRGGRVPVFRRYAAGADFGPHIMSRGSYHAGIVRPALYALEAGSTVVVNERFEPLELERQVIEVGASSLFLSPEQLYDFAHCSTEEMPTLERIMFGGDYMPLWMRQAVAERFGERLIGFYGTSVGAISEYGLSEIRRPMSVGRPYPHVQCRVTTREGLHGEVQVRRRGQADPSIGWEPTGDVGYIDESGNLALVGRDRWVDGANVTDAWHQLIETEGVFGVAINAREGRTFYDVEFDDSIGAEHRVRRIADDCSRGQYTLRLHARGALRRTESQKVYLEQ
ncbi:AMP-binding protein [Microbacterium foliorum]|uniref:AMP-binding protein n=1 Tax=Microbacterium foliorum TaxID=104336 RepID=UPI0028D2B5C5|nr:AMP-binding protein [Microbacterium foliorum]